MRDALTRFLGEALIACAILLAVGQIFLIIGGSHAH